MGVAFVDGIDHGAPVHLGHHQVGKHDLNLPAALFKNFKRLPAVLRSQNLETVLAEEQFDGVTDHRFVIDHQDRFAAAPRRAQGKIRAAVRRREQLGRQEDLENRPQPHGGGKLDEAVSMWERAIKLDGDNQLARNAYNRGVAELQESKNP